MRATHRNGQQGSIGDRDANGFAEFKADTGAKYTAHHLETIAANATPQQAAAVRKLWATWPQEVLAQPAERDEKGKITKPAVAYQSGTLRFAVEQGERGASKAFIVARTHPARAADLEDGRIYPGGPSSLLRAAS
jgi:hypothetical protein